MRKYSIIEYKRKESDDMVNREYIKSQIDTLPEEVVTGIDRYIARQIKKNSEKSKRNAKYIAELEQSRKDIAEGKGIAFEMEELENMTEMPIEEAKAFAAKRALEKGIELWQ